MNTRIKNIKLQITTGIMAINDEIGLLAGYFDRTFEKIQTAMRGVKAATQHMQTAGDQLSNNVQVTVSATEKITENIVDVRAFCLR